MLKNNGARQKEWERERETNVCTPEVSKNNLRGEIWAYAENKSIT